MRTPAGRSTGKVYPRVCGGTAYLILAFAFALGLSPRVRGNRPARPCFPFRIRSIPACAGEPNLAGTLWPALTVYPRVCGGTFQRQPQYGAAYGLSPRVRGNRAYAEEAGAGLRSIPACAGEPATRRFRSTLGMVYPRVCGGTWVARSGSLWVAGLSPRVRGNLTRMLAEAHAERSIPACAGEPMQSGFQRCRLGVYPRVCGGTPTRSVACRQVTGLSPRVRGNRRGGGDDDAVQRSIPACAGEPGARTDSRPSGPVYPRVCGGTRRPASLARFRAGLSPRVRGNHPRQALVQRGLGSIPACAGEPFLVGYARIRLEVYPRVCGGTGRHLGRPRPG